MAFLDSTFCSTLRDLHLGDFFLELAWLGRFKERIRSGQEKAFCDFCPGHAAKTRGFPKRNSRVALVKVHPESRSFSPLPALRSWQWIIPRGPDHHSSSCGSAPICQYHVEAKSGRNPTLCYIDSAPSDLHSSNMGT